MALAALPAVKPFTFPDNRFGVQPVMPVQIANCTSLAEVFDAQWDGLVPHDRPQPGQRYGVTVNQGDQFRMRGKRIQQCLDMRLRSLVAARTCPLRCGPAGIQSVGRRDGQNADVATRLWEENFEVYGVCKDWHQLQREGFSVARCTAERLMRKLGIQGAIRGKAQKTTFPDPALPCPLDKVNRQFRAAAPNTLWVSDFTYVSTWQGFVYVAFVIDTFANRIVGWRSSRSQKTQFVLDALEQALYERRPTDGLTHHSDRGGQYLSIRYTERLAEAGIEPSVGSVGDSYDNALAETIIGLFKAEVIHRLGPWKSADAVEWETLRWVDWFNNRRLLGPIGNIPPTEAERNFYEVAESMNMVA